MKAFKKSIYFEIALIVTIFLLSFLSFNYIFSGTTAGSYYQNIISALMGTLFTVVVTSFLLKQQVKSEELREQNVEVFKKKVEKYEKLITLLTDVLEDGKISHEEAILVKKSIYEVSLFCGKDMLDLIGGFLKQELIGNFDDDEKITILEITSKMREELNLENISTFNKDDLKPIDFLISSNFELIPLYKNIYKYLFEVRDTIARIACDMDNLYFTTAIENFSDTILFTINKEGSDELDSYIIEVSYPQIRKKELSLNLKVMKCSGKINYKKHEDKILEASKLDIEYIIDENLPNEILGSKSFLLNVNDNDQIVTDHQEIAKKILDDIFATENIFSKNQTTSN